MALEAELARLQAENARLLRLLKLTLQQAAPPGPAQAAYFEASPFPADDGSPPAAKVAFYATLFAARTDVYATRFDNPHTGKGLGPGGDYEPIRSRGRTRQSRTIGFAIVIGVDEWDVYQTDEVAAWLRELQDSDPKTADLVDDAISR
jgi:hypothetical protein